MNSTEVDIDVSNRGASSWPARQIPKHAYPQNKALGKQNTIVANHPIKRPAPNMPTLRVELLKSREEDEYKEFVVHGNRGGYPQHPSKLKKSLLTTEAKPARDRSSMGKVLNITQKKSILTTEAKLVRDRGSMGKVLNITQKLGVSEVNGGRPAPYKTQTPQSPSESDSFSIRSSSSSCKSEADSIKKPSPPTSAVKPSTIGLHMNLGSYLGGIWDPSHRVSPCNLSKAIHEEFHEGNSLQNGFLEFRFSEGRMVDSYPPQMDGKKAPNHACAEDSKSGLTPKYDCSSMKASEVVTPPFSLASACSPSMSLETSGRSSDTCGGPLLGQHELKDSQSIREFKMGESRDSVHEEEGISHGEGHEQGRRVEACHDSTCTPQATVEQDRSVHPSEADVTIDRVLAKTGQKDLGDCICIKSRVAHPRALSCHLAHEGQKHEEDFSFQVSPRKESCMQKTSSCRCPSDDQNVHPGVVSVQGKSASAKVCLEKYVFSTPLMAEKYVPSTQSHQERGCSTDYSPYLGCHLHPRDISRKLTRSDTGGAVTPPSVAQEIKCKATSGELTPVSPLSINEASTQDMYEHGYGRDDYFDVSWLATWKSQPPLSHPCKAHWDWRSKSIGARASLKSAVRNLEAAFGGSRSVSLPKARSQTDERERRSEGFNFIDRVFVSPAKNRHKRSEALKLPIQRLSYSGAQVPIDLMRSGMPQKRECGPDDNVCESAASNHCFIPHSLRPLNTQRPKAELKASRSMHSLTPSKDLSGHISPFLSTPPSSVLSQQTLPALCMLQGYLQCFERDGNTCYTLSLKDSEEMLVARANTSAHNSSKEGCKWIYTFQSGRSKGRGKGANGWKSWLKKEGKFITDLAGKMQVSSELCSEISPAGKRIQFLVSEFVLYDERHDDPARSQSLRLLSTSNGCHDACTPVETPLSAHSAYEFAQSAALVQKQASSIPHSPSSARMSSRWASTNHQPQPYAPWRKRTPAHYSRYSIDVWSDSDFAGPEAQQERLYPTSHSELAAIVIKMPVDEDGENGRQFSNVACRRSLKFSDDNNQSKAPQRDRQDRLMLNRTRDAATLPVIKQGGLLNHRTRASASGCVTMMLPKEHHGLPKGGLYGPTSLIDRWKCGGKCDCGGWDLGCGMNVFSNQRCEMLPVTSDHGNNIQSISDKQPLLLYSQGKTQKVLLSVSLVQEGYFILKFQSDLAPLKAFAAAVAILHSRESSSTAGIWMPPVAKTHQQYQSEPETVGRSNDRPTFLEVYNDIPTWCPSNPLALSPHGRA